MYLVKNLIRIHQLSTTIFAYISFRREYHFKLLKPSKHKLLQQGTSGLCFYFSQQWTIAKGIPSKIKYHYYYINQWYKDLIKFILHYYLLIVWYEVFSYPSWNQLDDHFNNHDRCRVCSTTNITPKSVGASFITTQSHFRSMFRKKHSFDVVLKHTSGQKQFFPIQMYTSGHMCGLLETWEVGKEAFQNYHQCICSFGR